MPSGYFVKETLDHFHNSLSKVLGGRFVKETLEFFHNSLQNMPIRNLSHSSRVPLKSTPLMGSQHTQWVLLREFTKNSKFCSISPLTPKEIIECMVEYIVLTLMGSF